MSYAQMPGSGLILPTTLAASVLHSQMFGGGSYRSTRASNRNTAGWITSAGSADTDTLGDVPTLRNQSSDLVRNEALPAGIIAANVTAVVGTGLLPQSRVNAEYLKISQEDAEAWQTRAEMIFSQCADESHWDSEHKLTFWQQQALMQRSMKERGDCFALRRYLPRAGKMLGLSVQIIEGDRVSTPTMATADASKLGKIRAGCEVDDNGAPVAWYVAQTHPGDYFQQPLSVAATPPADRWARVEARDANGLPLVLPLMNILRPGQTRGVPYLAPVIEMLKQLTRYTEAEIAAAVVSGMLAVMVTSPAPTGGGPLGALAGGIPGMVVGQPTASKQTATRMQSGMILDLKPGEDVKVVDSTRPNTAFDPFVTAVLRQIGAALEVPFEILVNHFQSSYSASRAALMNWWRTVTKERDLLVVAFCQPCWVWAITEAVASGKLNAPGFFTDPLARMAWLGCDWIGAGAPAIDPLKEANAARAWNELGIWSLQDISAQQGRDFDRTHRQLMREKRMRNEAGLVVQATVFPPEAYADPDEGDDEEKKSAE